MIVGINMPSIEASLFSEGITKMVRLFSALLGFLVAACGGGGGEVSLPPPHDYTTGIPSTESAADVALNAYDALPYRGYGGRTYSDLASAKSSLNGVGVDPIATRDTDARQSWTQGWTGKNVKVGVADDFNSNGIFDLHGDFVTLVMLSVAPEADLASKDMLGSTTEMTADAALQYFEENGYHIINASWGMFRFDHDTGAEWLGFDQYVSNAVANFDQAKENDKAALIIYAAGNNGYYCNWKRAEHCTVASAIVSKAREAGYKAGEKTVFVGSLADGTSDMADYSVVAGDLKNDFIVAHDDVLATGDAAGTSFAAPRVSGAAALVRQKFPNLTSAQLKQVILQTATDLGDAGVDEVYGHGKLNILGALSPVGNVVPKW